MKTDLVKDIFARGEACRVTVAGWVRTIRASKEFGFIELNDGTSQKNIQIVFDRTLENFDAVEKQNVSACLIVEGEVVLTPDARQPLEIHADKIVIHGESSPEFPIQKKKHSYEYLRSVAHLRPRTNTFTAVFRVRSVLTYAIHDFLQKNGFVYIATPCVTSSDCEGAGEVFRISTMDVNDPPRTPDGKIDWSKDFFGKQAFMTVSGQLNVEPFCWGFRKVYTFGPCFRAENSNTPRHAAEFWQVEPEMAFADLNDLMDTIEALSKYVIAYVLEHCPDELAFFDRFIEPGVIEKLQKTVSSDFARITYREALKILSESGVKFDIPAEWGTGIQTEHEKYLADEVFKRPVFVTDYPKECKSFYMRLNDDNETVAATDLLFPGLGEIVGASQREERLDMLLKRIKELGLKEEDYDWYLDLRRYGTCQHSGFGMGVERMMRFITGMENIRDVIPYPRTPNNAEF
ncbi:MAG: asparagine--tRNA ligase [Clostridia bacterium]|nr:asparagine--tRNA ligase [Clostridia bacterium]